jgi:hypothetical protein
MFSAIAKYFFNHAARAAAVFSAVPRQSTTFPGRIFAARWSAAAAPTRSFAAISVM